MELKYPQMTDDQKKEMWEQIAYWMSMTEEERASLGLPVTNTDIYTSLEIPMSTFYWKQQDEEFMRKIVKNGLTKAKKLLPKLLRVLEKNIEEGKEKSMEMGFKYIAEVAEKFDHTSKGQKMGVDLTLEQQLKLAHEIIYANNRGSSNPSEQVTPNGVLPDNGQELRSELAPPSDSGSTGESGAGGNNEIDNRDAAPAREEHVG